VVFRGLMRPEPLFSILNGSGLLPDDDLSHSSIPTEDCAMTPSYPHWFLAYAHEGMYGEKPETEYCVGLPRGGHAVVLVSRRIPGRQLAQEVADAMNTSPSTRTPYERALIGKYWMSD
jgi:hypothetical protein